MSSNGKKAYNMFERRQCIPIIYCRGTHYEVGYDVVKILILQNYTDSLELERYYYKTINVYNFLWQFFTQNLQEI